ncbi:MAG: phenylalanine--tRNA ligase subunit beta [Myxococcales bacterium]|nr:phenylalanine--tRNA ligase subunit beta [Myxococcales bacterium]
MKASCNWLRELLPALTHDATEIARLLTGAGLEVEGMTEVGAAATVCVVAKVESVRPHPTKSGLRLVTVDRGGASQEVVCGAPNVPEPGGLVVLAPLGAHLPAAGLTVGKRAIGGVESEGMLCSESELGLGDDHDGIIVLPAGFAEPGTTLAAAEPNAHDWVLEIGLTPNRPDGLGHLGLARDLATVLGVAFSPKAPALPPAQGPDVASLVTIEVADAERCPHYGASAVVDVKVGPSPLSVRWRLQALGVRSISNVVDVTNLVMLECAHPMHGFDLARVRGAKIVVRRAAAGERLTTLDGVERELTDDDLLICDGQGGVALAGVMGGASSEIQADTTRVLFECAWFDPRGVRRASRRHGLHTESSHRFERGVDTDDVAWALDRACELTLALAGGKLAKGRLHVQGGAVSAEPSPTQRPAIALRHARVESLLGLEIPWADALGILERLGCRVVERGEARASVVPPTHRPDLHREIDLVEEIVRIHGIDRVPAIIPAIHGSRDVGGREALARRARAACVALGLSEAITFGFTREQSLTALRAPAPFVRVKNPLAEHHSVMRTSLLPGLLEVVGRARRHGVRDVRVFTVGPVFLDPGARGGPDAALPDERLCLAVVLAGDRPGYLERPRPLDVWDATGTASAIVRSLASSSATVVPAPGDAAPAHLHPRGAAFIELGGVRVGRAGPLHPDVVDALELDGPALVVELELAPIADAARVPTYAPIPKYPASTRDMAVVVEDAVRAGEVEAAVRASAGPFAEAVELFDRFAGGAVPEGHTSLAFRVVYRAADRTLTDAEVEAAHANVVREVEGRFGARLRA